ncbi:hypothetical protein DL89DRAFT_263773 [Linderina pennispora]|uniref:Uncharacterized protein n=1 Tax=Linderina pennispora TaxID=61395 RepID=A0A1Y1WK61_9FUNG|nr:uncharacterized protein DL89DRAFT_263773 [Linderina pennispora]ORX73755.1 hypothetical protein DL89DRAFT_263773 [Linderina pennispora]
MDFVQEFTFFDAHDTSKSAIVYSGHFGTKDSTVGHPIAYTVQVERRNIAVYGSPSTGGQVLVAGSLEGITRSYASLSGIGGSGSAKKEGHFRGAWSFTDFKGNAYKWDVKVIRNQYRLTKGHLYILKPISEDLLSLVILTKQLVHNRTRSSEQRNTQS